MEQLLCAKYLLGAEAPEICSAIQKLLFALILAACFCSLFFCMVREVGSLFHSRQCLITMHTPPEGYLRF